MSRYRTSIFKNQSELNIAISISKYRYRVSISNATISKIRICSNARSQPTTPDVRPHHRVRHRPIAAGRVTSVAATATATATVFDLGKTVEYDALFVCLSVFFFVRSSTARTARCPPTRSANRAPPGAAVGTAAFVGTRAAFRARQRAASTRRSRAEPSPQNRRPPSPLFGNNRSSPITGSVFCFCFFSDLIYRR